MNLCAWYNSEGKIMAVGKYSSDFESARLKQYSRIFINEPINPDSYYVDLVTLDLITYPPPPTPRAKWNGALKAWTLSLEEERVAKQSELKQIRDLKETQGFDYVGKRFDSDAKSIKRLHTAILAALTATGNYQLDWTCQDGSSITLDKNQLLAMPAVIASKNDTLQKKAKKLKDDIATATTVEQVLAIKWTDN